MSWAAEHIRKLLGVRGKAGRDELDEIDAQLNEASTHQREAGEELMESAKRELGHSQDVIMTARKANHLLRNASWNWRNNK